MGSERVTSNQPPEAHPRASRRAVQANGFGHVVRAGRLEPAAAREEERREKELIRAQQAENGPLGGAGGMQAVYEGHACEAS